MTPSVGNGIHGLSDAELLEIARAHGLLGSAFGGGERRQQHRRQYRDDGDDHQ